MITESSLRKAIEVVAVDVTVRVEMKWVAKTFLKELAFEAINGEIK